MKFKVFVFSKPLDKFSAVGIEKEVNDWIVKNKVRVLSHEQSVTSVYGYAYIMCVVTIFYEKISAGAT
jgi:hypothetical protein